MSTLFELRQSIDDRKKGIPPKDLKMSGLNLGHMKNIHMTDIRKTDVALSKLLS